MRNSRKCSRELAIEFVVAPKTNMGMLFNHNSSVSRIYGNKKFHL